MTSYALCANTALLTLRRLNNAGRVGYGQMWDEFGEETVNRGETLIHISRITMGIRPPKEKKP